MQLLECLPATSADVDYGTPAMALEVKRLFAATRVRDEQIFAMAGHADGIVSFGASVDAAFAALMRHRVR